MANSIESLLEHIVLSGPKPSEETCCTSIENGLIKPSILSLKHDLNLPSGQKSLGEGINYIPCIYT